MPHSPFHSEFIGRIVAISVGKALAFADTGERSAIDKQRLLDRVAITVSGVAGDEVGDPSVHGGADKAVHQYPREHYALWRAEVGERKALSTCSAFGENFHSTGMTEHNICIGDKVQIRNTVLLVTQFRQPCWKLNVRFKIRDMSLRMQRTGRTGWYYRVLKEGQVQEGDAVSLIERPHPQWPLSRLIELYYSGKVDRAALEEILKLPLPLAWHKTIQKRIETGVVESWDRRLFGKARPKRA